MPDSSGDVSESSSFEAQQPRATDSKDSKDSVVVGHLLVLDADAQAATTTTTATTTNTAADTATADASQLDGFVDGSQDIKDGTDSKDGKGRNVKQSKLSQGHSSRGHESTAAPSPLPPHADVVLGSMSSARRGSDGNGNGSVSGSGKDWSAGGVSGTSVSDEDEDDDVEDYDTLGIDRSALVAECKGGGVEMRQYQSSFADFATAPGAGAGAGTGARGDVAAGSGLDGTRIGLERRKSIQITLEKTNRRGRYVLKADDPEIREVLRSRIQREEEEALSKSSGSTAAGKLRRNHSRFQDLVFTRQFTTFDRQNPLTSQSPFHGFFTLFWLICAALLIRVAAKNQRTHGSVFGGNELMHMMFDRDVLVMGLTDGAMCAGTAFGLLLQRMILKGWLSWNGSGWIIQNVWQTAYLGLVVGWTFYREWPWTHSIFIVLHAMVFLMKQHSYAFYNGYLSQVYRRKAILERKLKQLDEIDPLASPKLTSSASTSRLTTGYQKPSSPSSSPLQRRLSRRKSTIIKASTDLQSEESEISRIARAIESEVPLNTEQLQAFKAIIKTEIDQLADELHGKSTSTANYYPANLTLANFADWTCLPTLVYELEYPRQERRNWWYIAEKTAATFGVIWVMMVISQAYIYPPVAHTLAMKEAGLTLPERSRELPWTVIDMLLPLLLEQLLSWYVIWECLLNVLAELTLFADRGFYGDWWNSVSWDQYARDWNRPVHTFLLRHVYHSSISALHVSKLTATFMTFLLSALVHELVMFVLFKKVRGYLFAMQLMQVPLVMMSRTSLLKGKDLLGNVVFWIGMFVGPSLLTSLYLIV